MRNRISRIALALCALALPLTAPALAEDCGLKRMASLDMLNGPGGVLAVPVTVNGTPLYFTVDTAGTYTTISQWAVNSLHVEARKLGPQVYSSKRGVASELYDFKGNRYTEGAILESLKIGNNEAKNFHVLVRPDSAEQSRIAGTLGPDLLELFDVELDFAAKKVTLYSQDHCEGKVVYWARDYATVPFTLTSSDKINLVVTLDGHELGTTLATGTPDTFLMVLPAKQLYGADASDSAANKDSSGMPPHQFKSLTLSGIAVSNPVISIVGNEAERSFRREHGSKMDSDAIYGINLDTQPLTLGSEILSHLHLYIAYKEHKIYATAADAHL
jgi:aspartyl protease